MKVEWRLMMGVGLFVLPFAALYWVTSDEPAGSIALAFFILALLFLGGWLYLQARRTGPRPEDRTDARPEDGDPDVGYFPDRSIWPFVIGTASMMIGLGAVFSRWVALPGVVLLAVAVVAYAREADVGGPSGSVHGGTGPGAAPAAPADRDHVAVNPTVGFARPAGPLRDEGDAP